MSTQAVQIETPRITVGFQRSINKRKKVYSAEAHFAAVIHPFEFGVSDFTGTHADKRAEQLVRLVLGLESARADFYAQNADGSESTLVTTDHHVGGFSENRVVYLTVKISRLYTKPSDVPNDAPGMFAGGETIERIWLAMDAAIADAKVQVKEDEALRVRCALANHIARELANDADKAARAACRYSERLAGLQAELAASQETALAKEIVVFRCDQRLVYPDRSSSELVDPRVVEAACKHAHEFLPSGSLGRLSALRDTVTPEEVK